MGCNCNNGCGGSFTLPSVQGGTGTSGNSGTNGINGADGVSVSSASIDGNGNLIITYSNGTVSDAGTVVGSDGNNGTDGANISGVNKYSHVWNNVSLVPSDIGDGVTTLATITGASIQTASGFLSSIELNGTSTAKTDFTSDLYYQPGQQTGGWQKVGHANVSGSAKMLQDGIGHHTSVDASSGDIVVRIILGPDFATSTPALAPGAAAPPTIGTNFKLILIG
jgi:hypothetical protein